MMKRAMLIGIFIGTLIPSAALAQESCEQRTANRTAGTVVGAAAGALLGSAVAGHHKKTTGAIVGGLAGGLIGNQITKGPQDCGHAYGWYDDAGRWHANAVDRAYAHGYYDRTGEWVEGEPAGHYDSRGVWVAPSADAYSANAVSWSGYPDLQPIGERIRGKIIGGVRDDLIQPDDARELIGRLGDIEVQEGSEFRSYGWNLPGYDRQRLLDQLQRLDRDVDAVRAEP